jgi:hypothetical protein
MFCFETEPDTHLGKKYSHFMCIKLRHEKYLQSNSVAIIETGWGGMDWIDLTQDGDQWTSRKCTNISVHKIHITFIILREYFLRVLLNRSRYSDWLRTRRRGRSSSTGRTKNFFFYTASRQTMGPTQPPIQWVPGSLSPGRKAHHSPPARVEVKKMWICI